MCKTKKDGRVGKSPVNFVDITGQRFNHWRVIEKVAVLEGRSKKHSYWLCECDCGKQFIKTKDSLTTKNYPSISCGCIKRERKPKPIEKRVPHSLKRMRNIWHKMKSRCYNENSDNYYRYGGRGIKICDRWLESFDNFKEDMYESYLEFEKQYGEDTATIDRIDFNGNYEPSNCRWLTMQQQSRNTSRTIKVRINGVTYSCLREVAEKFNLRYDTVQYRYKQGKRGKALIEPCAKEKHKQYSTAS